jgi:hypothetical protein
MSDPTSMDDHTCRSAMNMRVEGSGIETRVILPCPFCAAGNFMVVPVTDSVGALTRGAMCNSRGRSAKAIYHADEPGNEQFEIVQTGGPRQPDWLVPKIRRID